MIPRCGACKFFLEKTGNDIRYEIIYNMRILEFDGNCREFIYRHPLNPFFFSLRNKYYTCALWQWRGKKKDESDLD